ncbi:MAG: ABC transporter permease, partial [Lachnospiraceae bacterium]|nr:ABC transporter permease [Lachnospiraceae bacterium]
LVLLVTHESNLVDYYCDQVIGLKDGSVTEIRENEDANGYVGRDKNVVYLGEYEKNETTLGHVRLTCYGDDLPEDVSVRIVNRDGTLLLLCDSPRVKLVDANSEITFREGSFEEEQKKAEKKNSVQMEELPPFEGKNYGRLFHWKNAMVESVQQLRGPKSRGNKALKRVMGFFAVILVLLFAMVGKDIKAYLDARDSFNRNIFEVRGSIESLQPLYEEMKAHGSGIDSIMDTFRDEFDVNVDLFETFSYSQDHSFFGMVTPITARGAMLPMELAEGRTVVCGRGISELREQEVLISSFMAEKMLESSKMGFIKDVSDFIGLSIDGRRIAGIVKADEPAVYLKKTEMFTGRRYSLDMDPAKFMLDEFKITDQNKNQIAGVQVHSNDIEATRNFLYQNIKGKPGVRIYTPEDQLNDIAGEALTSMMKQFAIVLIFVLMLSFCMLMIMRSSVMSRIREIGVYRCIGVTRKNMYFRFMVEGLLTAALYILPTFLIIVGAIHWLTHCSGVQVS